MHGDFLPRTLFDRFYILFAIIRALYLAFIVSIQYPHFDVIFCDQNAAYIPILKLLTSSKILFYCHHPDYVQTSHTGFLKRLYRLPFDLFEEYCVSMADTVLVNSLYTQSVYKKSFRTISQIPEVLYPAVDFETIRKLADACPSLPKELAGMKYFISVNRYERKKGVEKAILGFAKLRIHFGNDVYEKQKLRLVIAGGYDPRLTENVEYFNELNELAIVALQSFHPLERRCRRLRRVFAQLPPGFEGVVDPSQPGAHLHADQRALRNRSAGGDGAATTRDRRSVGRSHGNRDPRREWVPLRNMGCIWRGDGDIGGEAPSGRNAGNEWMRARRKEIFVPGVWRPVGRLCEEDDLRVQAAAVSAFSFSSCLCGYDDVVPCLYKQTPINEHYSLRINFSTSIAFFKSSS